MTFRGSSTNDLKYPAASTEAVAPTADGSTQATRLGAVYNFASTTVNSRVGVSWISSAQACSNVNTEIPANTQLETLVTTTKNVWNSKLLSKVTTTEVRNIS